MESKRPAGLTENCLIYDSGPSENQLKLIKSAAPESILVIVNCCSTGPESIVVKCRSTRPAGLISRQFNFKTYLPFERWPCLTLILAAPSRGRVRTAFFLRRSMMLGRLRPRSGGEFNFSFYFDRKYSRGRSPELICVDLCSVFQAGAVRDGPGPNFGQKPTQYLQKLKNMYFNFNFHVDLKHSWVASSPLPPGGGHPPRPVATSKHLPQSCPAPCAATRARRCAKR